MSGRKHTPGPWHVEDDGTVQHQGGMVICVPSYAEDFPCLTEDEGHSEEEVRAEVDAECDANAVLIAAAPDLLSALRDLCDAWDADHGGAHRGNVTAATKAARIVIAKAESGA